MIGRTSRVLVDGRVFSSDAHDRGMGRYVTHIIETLLEGGHDVTVLLFRECHLTDDDWLMRSVQVRFANYGPESGGGTHEDVSAEIHGFTHFLSTLVERDGYDVYIDATPFLRPCRTSILACTTIVVLYDYIPLKHLAYYVESGVVRRCYDNGLLRVVKADLVISISATVATEATQLFGIPESRMVVLYPRLEPRYVAHDPSPKLTGRKRAEAKPYLFAILGAHKSKNPEGSLTLYRQLLAEDLITIRLNCPKENQLSMLKEMPESSGFVITASITDDEKFGLQREAAVVTHLSIEEGFGIPLLEALFLGRKVVVLDMPMNHEVIAFGGASFGANVFLLKVGGDLDPDAFRAFLAAPADPLFTARVRKAFIDHWSTAAATFTAALHQARTNFDAWIEQLQFAMVSSIPGTFCGVADYTLGYVRSATGTVALFYSEGDERTASYLRNVRLLTVKDYRTLIGTRLADTPTLFNFAVSPALMPGLDLARTASRPGDVVLIHEKEYFGGFRAMLESTRRGDDLVLAFDGATGAERDRTARAFVMHPFFNRRLTRGSSQGAAISGRWLADLPARKVSHIPPDTVREMDALSQRSPELVMNDLAPFDRTFDYVPMGIDPRRDNTVLRAARRFRTEHGIQQDDIVIGHFGLIVSDIKMLAELLSAIGQYLRTRARSRSRLFLVLAGRILDFGLFGQIEDVFDDLGIPERLIQSNPILEQDFEAQIAACDLVFCFRKPVRGHYSHVLVRTLSLGVPVVVNKSSGYGWDPELTVRDDHLEEDIAAILDKVQINGHGQRLSALAIERYCAVHKGSDSLSMLLGAE